jgi:predicted nucleic acid-binding protein
MKLVIDTNCIISSLIKNGLSRRIIISPAIQFITPEFTYVELFKYEDLIRKKAHLTSEEFSLLIELLFEYISIVPKEEYKDYFQKAAKLIDDVDDIPYIALYFAKSADGIWTDDKHFKKDKK